MSVGLAEIRQAAEAISGQVVRTPLMRAERLSQLYGCELHLKLENLQITGSFKDRGACMKLQSLSDEQRRRGVIHIVQQHGRRLR